MEIVIGSATAFMYNTKFQGFKKPALEAHEGHVTFHLDLFIVKVIVYSA